ncbi:MAG: HD domain-containing protein [Clostridiales bacterium]|nr:HD domain-containing protein [Clostridiales bacterium]
MLKDRLMIKHLGEGTAQIYLLLKNVNEWETKNGKPWLLLQFFDGDQEISAKMWDCGRENFPVQPGTVLLVELRIGTYNDAPDYTVTGYRPAAPEEIDLAEFTKAAPLDPAEMYSRIMQAFATLEDADVRRLAETVYSENAEKLMYWPAAKNIHHDMLGGLLYHSYRMVCSAMMLSKVYTSANRSYLVAGAALHDIGKLQELASDQSGVADYTVPGNLFGHIYLGCSMVEDCAKRIGISGEPLQNILHIIASHHGQPEYGAIVRPATLEAFLVSEMDMVDAKVMVFEEQASRLQPGMMTSDRAFWLDTRVYRPGEGGSIG